MRGKAVLFIDDQINILKSINRTLVQQGYKIYTATNSDDALEILEKEPVPVVVSDQRMPGLTGSEFFALIKDRYPRTVRIIISGYTDFEALQDAVNQGEIFQFISKPWEEDDLISILEKAFTKYELNEKKDRNSRAFENVLEGIVLTDQNNLIESVNITFLIATGFSKNELISKNIWKLFPYISSDDQQDILREIQKNNTWQGETQIKSSCGLLIKGILSISQIKDEQRNRNYRTFSFIDITELYQPKSYIQDDEGVDV